ncbi:MAG: TetR/AcrR family transcriptional regulator [Actinobacteria bacterium]|nr:TetR/AcrR family transcriptional regulator [Actinomycetota bacterium]
MGRYRAGLETQRRILEATRELLSDVGLEGTTMKAVCDRAGVGAGSFYNLFDSKEEAVLSVVREAIAAIDPASRAGEGARGEGVADLVDAYLRFLTGEPDLARIYLQAAVAWGLSDPALASRFRRHQDHRRDRLQAAMRRQVEGLDEPSARNRAELLLAALNGLSVNWLLDRGMDLESHRDRLVAFGLQPADR